MQSPYSAFDVVGLAASTDGLRALTAVLAGLPVEFPAAAVVVQHRRPDLGAMLPELLRRHTRRSVKLVEPGEAVGPGLVYVTPPDHLVVVSPGRRLIYRPEDVSRASPRRCRADGLFASLAAVFGARVIGVVLTGRLEDGAAGVEAIKGTGGRVIAQDRSSSEQFGMPSAAISTGCVDLVLPLERIAHALVSLVMWPGAADLLRVPLSPWATPGRADGRAGAI